MGGKCRATNGHASMTKTDLAYEPSRLAYPRGPKPDDKPKPTLPKDGLNRPQAPRSPPSVPTTDRPLSAYLTRKQGAQFINDELGMPLSFSTAAKLASWGEFAEPALWWGSRPLYTRGDLRRWAEARSRKLEAA
jgi:hypothetical protein